MTDDTVWGCPTCWTLFESGVAQNCTWCLAIVSPIMRWSGTLAPVDPAADRATGELVCLDCGAAKLCLGGPDVRARLLEGWCAACADDSDTAYADGREAYCCAGCRAERRVAVHLSEWRDAHGGDVLARVFADACDYCMRPTDTVKVDPHAGPEVLVCDLCRAEWEGALHEACRFCQEEHSEPVDVSAEAGW